jgi:hypothetical protein
MEEGRVTHPASQKAATGKQLARRHLRSVARRPIQVAFDVLRRSNTPITDVSRRRETPRHHWWLLTECGRAQREALQRWGWWE